MLAMRTQPFHAHNYSVTVTPSCCATTHTTSKYSPSAGEVIWKKSNSSPPIESIRYPTALSVSQGPVCIMYLLPGKSCGTFPTSLAPLTVLALTAPSAGRSSRETSMPPGDDKVKGATFPGAKSGGSTNTSLHVLPGSGPALKTNKVERVGESCATY